MSWVQFGKWEMSTTPAVTSEAFIFRFRAADGQEINLYFTPEQLARFGMPLYQEIFRHLLDSERGK